MERLSIAMWRKYNMYRKKLEISMDENGAKEDDDQNVRR